MLMEIRLASGCSSVSSWGWASVVSCGGYAEKEMSDKPVMRARISKIGLIIYVVLFVLSWFLLSVPGDYWQWYSIMAGFAVAPVLLGPKRYRFLGGLALTFAIALVFVDIESGKHLRAKRQEMLRRMDSQSSTNGQR